MVEVIVRTNTLSRTLQRPLSATPKSIFAELGVNIGTSMVNLDGEVLRAAALDKTFEQLGVRAGESINLNAIVKADGAND